jgi:hypothetical protein
MPLNAAWLPMATPLDPAEEPPGSLDPLGTLNYAEALPRCCCQRLQFGCGAPDF